MAAIPFVLHQTWKTHEIPVEWSVCTRSFSPYHPDFTRIVWSDDDARQLVAGEFPGLLETFDHFPYAILRADLFRYLVLLRRGGVYADLDVMFLAPLTPLLADGGVVLGWEPPEHARSHGLSRLVSNAIMASEPGHPFWQRVLEDLRLAGPKCLTHRDVLELTGPIRLQRLIDEDPGYWERTGVRIRDAHLFNPLPSSELGRLRAGEGLDEELADRLRSTGSVALHVWSNTWIRALAGTLVNPAPDAIEGFVFFRGVDSIGFDVANVGRDAAEAAAACRQRDTVVAFNTDGFAKTRLRAPWRWRRMDNPGPGEGLYVKFTSPRGYWAVRLAQAWNALQRVLTRRSNRPRTGR